MAGSLHASSSARNNSRSIWPTRPFMCLMLHADCVNASLEIVRCSKGQATIQQGTDQVSSLRWLDWAGLALPAGCGLRSTLADSSKKGSPNSLHEHQLAYPSSITCLVSAGVATFI